MKESNTIDNLRQEIKRLRRVIFETPPNLETLLRTRGLTIYKSEPLQDLVIPETTHINGFYKKLLHYSFRIFLRDVIKHQEKFSVKDVAKYASPEVTEDYIRFMLEIGLVEPLGKENFRLIRRPIRSFGVTLEWLLAQIFKGDFRLEAIWGVKFRRPGVGGDYDLLAKINSSLLYMEIKSSPPKQVYVKEVAAYLDRVSDLNPKISIFFMDTELRMKDKMVPMFEDELLLRYPNPPKIRRMEKELFSIENKIFIMNAAGSIRGNIERILIEYFKPSFQFA